MPEPLEDLNRDHVCHFYQAPTGSHAMKNQYNCYHHHTDDMVPVFAVEAFPLEGVQDRAAIQIAVGDVLSRLAANTMDPKRATALLYGLQLASSNLPPHPRPARQPASEPDSQAAKPEDESPVPIERDFTAEEMEYLDHVTVVGFEPYRNPRPAFRHRRRHHQPHQRTPSPLPPLAPQTQARRLWSAHRHPRTARPPRRPHHPTRRVRRPNSVRAGCRASHPPSHRRPTCNWQPATCNSSHPPSRRRPA